MDTPKVFISRQLPKTAEDLLHSAGFEVSSWQEEQPIPKNILIEKCMIHHALLCTSIDEIDADFLHTCRHLKIISTFAVGYDNIDIRTATALGIPVGHTPGVLTEATAEIAFGLMISVARHFLDGHHQIGKGEWKYFIPTKNLGLDLKEKTLGVFGLGAIGTEMARRCKAVYNMDIIYHNRNRNLLAERKLGAQWVTFEQLLKRSDVLSVHASLNPETKGIFNADAFRKMKDTSIFINTSRGSLHAETDLTDALNSGQIWGAGLDVTNPEPMDAHHPLLKMPRVFVLPHIGSSTIFTRNEMARLAAENIILFFQEKRLRHQVMLPS